MGTTKGQTCKPLLGPTLHTHNEIPAMVRAGDYETRLSPMRRGHVQPLMDTASTTYPKQLFRTREGMKAANPHPP